MSARLRIPPKPAEVSDLEFLRVMTPYVLLRGLVQGKSVLEIGVGSGHGAWLLQASGASRLLAMDIEPDKVERVRRLCADQSTIRAVVGDAQRLAIAEERFDIVTCFEVIEHVADPESLLRGVRRLLARDGILALSTPNRRVRLLPLQKPWNPEHLREYSRASFGRLLREHFAARAIYGLFGDQESGPFYRNLWRQNPLRVYGFMAKSLLRPLLPRDVRSTVSPDASPEKAAPALLETAENGSVELGGNHWPFHVRRGDTRRALNFLAICGSNAAVSKAVEALNWDAS